MKSLKNHIHDFISRAGSYVFFAAIIARLLSFLASWIALQFIPNKELGIVLFAYNIIAFALPIGGFGLHQSLIRYGALLKSDQEKNSLFVYVFKKGIIASLGLIALIIGGSQCITFQFENTHLYVAGLSVIILPSFLFELIKIQFRLQHNNKKFAYAEIVYNITLVLSVSLLSYTYQEIGYALALFLTPVITVLFFIKKLHIDFKISQKLSILDFSFWKYGFFASLSNVVTQLLFVVDILLIGTLLNNAEMVTNYKYISLIPLSLLFLPRVFINTDFVTFTERIYNKEYIVNYIKNYMSLFTLISVVLCAFLGFFSKEFLSLFDPYFNQYNDSFVILVLGVCGILIFRGLFGNLLSSIGKAHVNFYITSVALFVNLISNYYLIPAYGIKGAAITSSMVMWGTGIVSAILFWKLYNHRFLSKK